MSKTFASIDDLSELHSKLKIWYEVFRRAEVLLSNSGDENSIRLLKEIDKEIQKCKHKKELLDQYNIQKLYEAVQEPDFPHAVRTWLEDEYPGALA